MSLKAHFHSATTLGLQDNGQPGSEAGRESRHCGQVPPSSAGGRFNQTGLAAEWGHRWVGPEGQVTANPSTISIGKNSDPGAKRQGERPCQRCLRVCGDDGPSRGGHHCAGVMREGQGGHRLRVIECQVLGVWSNSQKEQARRVCVSRQLLTGDRAGGGETV